MAIKLTPFDRIVDFLQGNNFVDFVTSVFNWHTYEDEEKTFTAYKADDQLIIDTYPKEDVKNYIYTVVYRNIYADVFFDDYGQQCYWNYRYKEIQDGWGGAFNSDWLELLLWEIDNYYEKENTHTDE